MAATHSIKGHCVTKSTSIADTIYDLVLANHILAHEGGLDAWGHVSVRHPEKADRFLLARSRSPELVSEDDIVEHGLDGEAANADPRPLYYERFIHAAIYEAHPATQAVVHSHADEVIPFTLTPEPLRPVMAAARIIGGNVPVWDIDACFGHATDLLVSDLAKGRDLAKMIGPNVAALMRGHGFVATGATLLDAVSVSIYLPRNAQILMNALRLGPVKAFSPGEIANCGVFDAALPGPQRAWEYWSHRLGKQYRPGAFNRSVALDA
jgi:ribulose-5-phosphate 4-epimerase/fuculose-1-phosphate aldolase